MGSIIYTKEIKNELDLIFNKLELFYPEHKIFSFDTLCPKQREAISQIASLLGVKTLQIVNDYGYEIITIDQARKIRNSIVYTPGNEPDIIKRRFSNMLSTLAQSYPDKIIETSIEKKHKKTAGLVSGFAVWLGYQTTSDFLKAYGYSYLVNSNTKIKPNVNSIISFLIEKYGECENKPQSIQQIKKENPEIVKEIEALERKSRECFGTTLFKHLIDIQVIKLEPKTETPKKENKIQRDPSKRKFKKESKTKVLSIQDIYSYTECLLGCHTPHYLNGYRQTKWEDSKKPEPWEAYIKITSQIIAIIKYKSYWQNFGTQRVALLEEIMVAFRDGETEYSLLKERLVALQGMTSANDVKKHKIEREWLKLLIKKDFDIFPPFKGSCESNNSMSCEEFIRVDENRIFSSNVARKYVVLDVETNGLRTANDDLLSISLYDPETGKIYNRLLPLELQPTVLTTYINGISDSDVENLPPLSQKELDCLIEEFKLANKTILFYSGGNFDSNFLSKYCKRHHLKGVDQLKFENIKKIIANMTYSAGNLSKDNLCEAIGIPGVSDVHSGENDCFLEWQLFERFVCERLFIHQNIVYKYSDDYIVPISYLIEHPKFAEFAKIKKTELSYNYTQIYSWQLPTKLVRKIRKFPTNISGISIENIITHMLGATECNNLAFLTQNKSKLKVIGMLPSLYEEIPVFKNSEGKLVSINPENEEYIRAVNATADVIKSGIAEVIDFVKTNIFDNKNILSQELVLSERDKVLALCDLSSENAILEIKTYDIFKFKDGSTKGGSTLEQFHRLRTDNLVKQMFYQCNGRKTYAMSIVFDFDHTKPGERVLNGLIFKIYDIEIKEETI